MRFRVKGVYTKNKPLAGGGTAVYVYHRKSGARIHAAPGTPDFLAEVERLNRGPASAAPVPNSMSALRRRYEASARFAGLAERTQAEYRRALNTLETMIGPFAVAGIRHRRARAPLGRLSARRAASLRRAGRSDTSNFSPTRRRRRAGPGGSLRRPRAG